MSAPNDVEALLADQQKEYGTYVAKFPIFYGNVRAFNAGDAVPVSHVEAYGHDKDGTVVKVGTKAHDAVVEAVTPADPTPEG